MNDALKDKKILVTRPADQAVKLCAMIEAAGGQAINLPAISIELVPVTDLLQRCLSELYKYQIGIFISQNAVQHTLNLLQHDPDRLESLSIIAIGAATAAALKAAGIVAVPLADTEATSETLLELPELQSGRVQGCNILIFRGIGGRELLAETLRARGAQVDYVEVYRRVPARYEQSVLDNIWFRQKPDLIVASSNEGLQNLLDMSGPEQRQIMQNTPLVVLSRRMSDQAQALGFGKAPLIAEETTDQGLFQAILESIGE